MPRYSNAASALVALILFSCTSSHAQRPPENQPDMTIDESVRARVIDAVRKALNDDYVFPDVASKMDEAIRNRVKNKEYDGITSAKGLATALTDHLQAVSHDKHLRVFYNHDTIPKRPEGQREPTAQDRERMRRQGVAINHGFEKVERLEGNVGLIVFNMFFSAEFAGQTAIAAINFLGSTDALIFIDASQRMAAAMIRQRSHSLQHSSEKSPCISTTSTSVPATRRTSIGRCLTCQSNATSTSRSMS